MTNCVYPTSFLATLCINDHIWIRMLLIGLLTVTLCLVSVVLKFGMNKQRSLKKFNPYRPTQEQTYCILSVHLIQLSLSQMAQSFVFVSLTIFMLLIGNAYSELFVSSSLIECVPDTHGHSWLINQTPLTLFKIAMQVLLRLNFQSIVLMQIYEWYAMLYLIET